MRLVRSTNLDDFNPKLIPEKILDFDLFIRITKSGIVYGHIADILDNFAYEADSFQNMKFRIERFMEDLNVRVKYAKEINDSINQRFVIHNHFLNRHTLPQNTKVKDLTQEQDLKRKTLISEIKKKTRLKKTNIRI